MRRDITILNSELSSDILEVSRILFSIIYSARQNINYDSIHFSCRRVINNWQRSQAHPARITRELISRFEAASSSMNRLQNAHHAS